MSSLAELSFTGERFLPNCSGEIVYEHWHRYAFARQFARGKTVVDAACGEGYGSALLAEVAEWVVGIDIATHVIAHASTQYANRPRLTFLPGSCTAMPLASASVDVVVSFETIEHLGQTQQIEMIAEFRRVLKPGGLLVLSSPNKSLYSDARGYVNEFHVHELYRSELELVLGREFPYQRWFHQQLQYLSVISGQDPDPAASFERWRGDGSAIKPDSVQDGMYFVVVAAMDESSLPPRSTSLSLFSDATDSLSKQTDMAVREALRLDALLLERDGSLSRQTWHINHLETLVAERDRIIVQRDTELQTLKDTGEQQLAQVEKTAQERRSELEELAKRVGLMSDEIERLNATVATQQRLINFRQSWRWWLQLPWLRLRRAIR